MFHFRFYHYFTTSNFHHDELSEEDVRLKQLYGILYIFKNIKANKFSIMLRVIKKKMDLKDENLFNYLKNSEYRDSFN